MWLVDGRSAGGEPPDAEQGQSDPDNLDAGLLRLPHGGILAVCTEVLFLAFLFPPKNEDANRISHSQGVAETGPDGVQGPQKTGTDIIGCPSAG